jgi:hypothetical protein
MTRRSLERRAPCFASHLATPAIVVLACAIASGCGADPALTAARATLANVTRVVTDLDARVDRGPEGLGPDAAARVASAEGAAQFAAMRGTLQEAGRLIDRGGRGLDLWAEDGGGVGVWVIVRPCLAIALFDLRAQLGAFGIEVPLALEQSLLETGMGGGRCGRREVPPVE